ncbi:hypothetical protein T11_7254 [Trichinella zimbabwensis]|uniref:Uncharacterized protein n=1 Tax=Trichinella zimbabwensis TaxID=268475 RepID=A0A0V1H9P9_9BILA|nr:hypothetical protein T11_7254 [Trichinella zimbabwensis]
MSQMQKLAVPGLVERELLTEAIYSTTTGFFPVKLSKIQ